jgi:alkylated DNA repair protein (DNA oxidative demethylase)
VTTARPAILSDLLDDVTPSDSVERLAMGAVVLRGFARGEVAALVAAIKKVAAAAPFRNMMTPGGLRMSVAMTNCGLAGWVTDRRGYRYEPADPLTGRAWPPMPGLFRELAVGTANAAGFAGFDPDACLINRYEPGSRLSLHRDENERDLAAPIVSVSLGLPAVFLFGGSRRTDRARRIALESGDVVVWGGPSRLNYHGVAPLPEGEDRLTGRCRFNLTLRQAL